MPAEVCKLDLKNGKRSRRRVRDLVTQLAFEGRSQNETERARISMIARSDLLHARAVYRCARPTIPKIQLATHGRPDVCSPGTFACHEPVRASCSTCSVRLRRKPGHLVPWMNACISSRVTLPSL